MAKRVLPQLARDGKVTRAWIGLSIQDINYELASKMGLAHPDGVIVSDVTPGSPAAKAGLAIGDVVVRLDGRPVGPAHKLRWEVACEPVGKRIAFEVLRDHKQRRVMLTTALAPAAAPLA